MRERERARCGGGCSSGSHSAESSAGGGRPFSLSTSHRHYERDRPFSVVHLAVDWALWPAEHKLTGHAELTVKRVDAAATLLELDAIAFDITSVRVGSEAAKYSYDGRVIAITVAPAVQDAVVRVDYSVEPRRGMYFIEPDAHYPNKPHQVWTQCQEEDARYFVPCHDKPHVKMTSSVRVSVPKGWTALSNGALTSRDESERPSFHWEMKEPHASYLLTLVAGEFSVLTDESALPPLTYYVPKGQEDDAKETFKNTRRMVAFLEQTFGTQYPWNKYAQAVVSDFIFGGMENTTATTLYEHVILDARARIDCSSEDLIVHELAHQWFGDYVTCRDWSEGWLNEGFATYCEHLWREHAEGADAFEYGLLTDLESYVSEARGRYRRPIVCQDYDAPLDLFDRHLYEKGSLFLHGLRLHLGDANFREGVSRYLKRFAKGIVETRDFQRCMEESTGRSLARFFDEGLYKPGHADLDVDVAYSEGILKVAVKQTHSATDGVPSVFSVALELLVTASDGSETVHTLVVDKRVETFSLEMPSRPRFVCVDPRMRVLGDVTVKAPNDMLRAQLKGGKTARSRWLAVHALAGTDEAPTLRDLAERLQDEGEFWGVRVECAHALGKLHAKAAQTALLRAASTVHAKVRRAVVKALGNFSGTEVVALLTERATKDESYLVCADAARALGKTRDPSAQATLKELSKTTSWADLIEAAAVDGLAASRDIDAFAHVETASQLGRPTRVRRAAIGAMPKLRVDRTAREAVELHLNDSDPHLRIDVARALLDLGDTAARRGLQERLALDLDPRVRRRIREVLRDLSADGKKAQSDLRDDLEKLRIELQKALSKMSELDARTRAGNRAKPKKDGAS
jgi:aminopeptidase N